MAELLKPLAERLGDGPAIVEAGGPSRTRTWIDLNDRVNKLVNALRAVGLTTGDTVAVLSRNRIEFFEAFLAVAHGGWVGVPVNWHWTADELVHVIEDSGAVVALVDSACRETAVAAMSDPRAHRCRNWWFMSGVDDRDTADLPDGAADLEEVLAAHDADEPGDQVGGGPMFYTSGTTGFPKGVKSGLSATGGPVAMLQLISGSFLAMLDVPSGGVTYLNAPAYHSAQWVFSMFPLVNGSTLVMTDTFDPAFALEVIDRHRVTNTHLVPTQFTRLLRLPTDVRDRFDGGSLRVVYHGAAPCPEEVKRQMIDWWGPKISEYYGGTEGGFLTRISADEWLTRPASIGRAVDIVELKVVTESGAEAAVGETGQIYFRSRVGADFEYHDDPEKTRSAHLDDGWGTLGDVGALDEDGYLTLSDRKIDMIISGGVNIYPAEVEGALVAHPAVLDAAVFGVPDDEMGESVRAAVQLVDPAAASDACAEELRAHLRERLASYKTPKVIDFVTELPRTPTGKLLKRQLRDPFWSDSGRSI